MLVFASSVATLLLVALVLYKRSRLDLDRVPAASLHDLLALCLDPKHAHEWFRDCHERYGPIFRCRIFHREIVMVADPLVASQVLSAGPRYLPRKCSEYAAIDPAHSRQGYTGMLSHADERIWKAHRSAIAPAYTLSAIKPLQPRIMEQIVQLAHRVGASVQGSDVPVDVCIDHQMLATAICIELETFMGLSLLDMHVDPLAVADDMGILMLQTETFVANFVKKVAFCSPWLSQLCKAGREFHAARTRFCSLTERVADILAARGPYDDTDYSLPACFMRMQDPHRPGKQACQGAIAAEVANSLLASETVPATVAWTAYMVALHPDVQDRLVEEMVSVGVPVGDTPEAIARVLLNSDSIKRLLYLQAVLNESMRLHPAGAPASNRVADRPVKVGQYTVPAGTYVWPNLYAIMTYSGNWECPLQFDPDRWSDPGAATHPATGAPRFVPFSIGPKSCAAQNLALLEARWAVAMLLACYKLGTSARMGDHAEVLARTEMGFVYRPSGGHWLTVQQRRLEQTCCNQPVNS